jgi:lipoprotein-releasing system permease protein
MNYLTLFLAWRYLKRSSTHTSFSTMITICVASIGLGSFALALIISIMHGFEKATHEKLQSIHPQITMRSKEGFLNATAIGAVMRAEFPEIVAWSASSNRQVMIQNAHNGIITPGVFLTGVDPLHAARVVPLDQKIIVPPNNPSLHTLLSNPGIIIGKQMAKELDVAVGEMLNVLYPSDEPDTQTFSMRFQCTPTVLLGIIETGIEELDAAHVITSLEFFSELFPDSGIDTIAMRLMKDADERTVIAKLIQRTGTDVSSWKDLYPALLAALKLQKYAMFLILLLIIVVASTTIVSLLFMYIAHKQHDIALLKSLGCSQKNIHALFLIIGIIITAFGSSIGLFCAGVVGYVLQRYPCITLPDAYYVSSLPITLEWRLYGILFILIMSISLSASILATKQSIPRNNARLL